MKYSRNSIIQHEEQTGETRINKYLSEAGYCSRREADRLVADGKVKIDGQNAVMGAKVRPGQKIEVDNVPIELEDQLVYLAYHKPSGVVCTTDRRVHRNIIDAVGHPLRIFPVGRLDKLSTGLIFLTNDGDIVNKILRAGNFHEKEYIVEVDKPIDEDFLTQMREGVPILGTVTRKCTVKKEGDRIFRIILTQGLNRQIRRMCEYFGYEVTKLERVRIMNIYLGNLPAGKWRNLTPKELADLNRQIRDSKKTGAADTTRETVPEEDIDTEE